MPCSPAQRSYDATKAKESLRQLYAYLGMPAERIERVIQRTEWAAPPKPRTSKGRPGKREKPARK
jgi:hypothetical protein